MVNHITKQGKIALRALKRAFACGVIAACDKAKAPNQALLDAAKLVDESGIK